MITTTRFLIFGFQNLSDFVYSVFLYELSISEDRGLEKRLFPHTDLVLYDLSYLCLWLCTQKFTIHVSRWSQPQQIREGSPSSSYLQVCVRDCMKRAQMTSWLHNCTPLIKMADIMLLSTCIQKTELWLTFQQCCCLWYWEMALALSLFNSIMLKQCRALIVPIGLAGKGMKRFFLFFFILAEYAMTISNVPTWMRIQS